MARLIWTEPALNDLDEIAEYIALDDPVVASRFVQRVLDRVERFEAHPQSGKRPQELTRTHYREVVGTSCRIFYRVAEDNIHMLHVMRSERMLRSYLLELRDEQP